MSKNKSNKTELKENKKKDISLYSFNCKSKNFEYQSLAVFDSEKQAAAVGAKHAKIYSEKMKITTRAEK